MKLLSKYSWTIILSLTACIFLSNTQAEVKAMPGPTQDTSYIWIPNAFTPDGDGMNDEFKVETNMELKSFSLTVQNVWGERIYHTELKDEGWDGTYKGEQSPKGVYVYIVKYRNDADGLPITETGPLHLLR